MAAANVTKAENDWDDVRLNLYKRGCFIDQLVKLYSCEQKSRKAKATTRIPLFDCLIVVGLQNDNSNEVYRPFIKMKYPEEHDDLPHGIEMFCFPDADYWSPNGSIEDEAQKGLGSTHFLVLTDLNGTRRFGYCRRIIPEGDQVPLPLAYCIITSTRSRIYPMILKELEAQHGEDDETTQEIFRLLHSQSFPSTVNEPILISHSGKIFKQIRRPLDTTLDVNHVHFMNTVGIDGLLKVFLSVLLEKRVIVIGRFMAQVSNFVESLCALLSPFAWQHTLIPLLPSHLVNILEAPTPYLIGLHDSEYLENESFEDVDDATIIHLDCDNPILSSMAEEEEFLTIDLVIALRDRLKVVEVLSDDEDQSCPALNIMISEAFTKFFLGLIGDVTQFIKPSDENGQPIFKLSKFLKDSTEDLMGLLDQFAKTAMFQAFIELKLQAASGINLSLRPKRPNVIKAKPRKLSTFQHQVQKQEPYSLVYSSEESAVTESTLKAEKDATKISHAQFTPHHLDSRNALCSARPHRSRTRIKSTTSTSTLHHPSEIVFVINEVTVRLHGMVNKILHVSTNETVSHLFKHVGQKNKLMAKNSIPLAPTAKIGDLYQIFKENDGTLHISVY